MKVSRVVVAALMAGAVSVAALASGPGGAGQAGGVTGSPHNLNNSGFSVPNSEVCLPCHTPHKAKIPNWEGALWNHAITSANFTTYTTKTGALPQPDGSSKLCLSCHDGVTAVDNFGNVGGTTAMTGSEVLGSDLSDDHPIGVVYPTTGAYIQDPATMNSGGIGTSKGVQLVDGKVECRSCHHSHNNALGNFLRTSNLGSALCAKCHTK